MIIVASDVGVIGGYGSGTTPTSGTSAGNVGFALASVGQQVARLERGGEANFSDMRGHVEPPPIALHASVNGDDPDLELLLAGARATGRITVSLDLHIGSVPDEAARARIHRQVSYAHVVTASASDLDQLYPDQFHPAVGVQWRRSGVACWVITSDMGGALLVAPNGLTYRRDPCAVGSVARDITADAFTAGLLQGMATAGALGDEPTVRLADMRLQDWLTVLERADQLAQAYAPGGVGQRTVRAVPGRLARLIPHPVSA